MCQAVYRTLSATIFRGSFPFRGGGYGYWVWYKQRHSDAAADALGCWVSGVRKIVSQGSNWEEQGQFAVHHTPFFTSDNFWVSRGMTGPVNFAGNR